jgi:hypothetical protein
MPQTDLTTSRTRPTISIAWLYVGAGLGMLFIISTAVVLITILRATQDNSLLITAIIGFGTTTFVSMIGAIKTQETKHVVREVAFRVDGRLSELIKATAASSRAEGQVEGAGIIAAAEAKKTEVKDEVRLP